MDESCRVRTGMMRGLPRRRSVEDRSQRRPSIFSGSETVDPVADDFADVFGGPPRTLLAHKFSSSGSFYEEIFRPPEFTAPASRNERSLPVFRIPARDEGFYNDIFGSDDERRSRERSGSQSKGTSSSALSSEELSPRRPAIGDDLPFSSYASKLRPINVPWRWNSSSMMPEEHPNKQGVPLFSCNSHSFEFQCKDNEYKDNFKSSNLGFSRKVTSPETISLESISYQSIRGFTGDWELNSPVSVVSSLCQEPEAKSSVHDRVLQEQVRRYDDDDEDDDKDEVMSSYVIEINTNLRREDCEASAIDEAIAWAKEKFQSRSSDEGPSMRNDSNGQTAKIQGSPDASKFHDDGTGTVQRLKKLETDTEKVDRDRRLFIWQRN